MAAATRAIVIHGHFYQPPRENPWLEAVEVQDSAQPSHDWNERITAECYAPNTAARRVDESNRILDIVNNFEGISFNIGPTLLSWLAREAPGVYRKILDADRTSVAARGHGNAIAQVYNHQIMPLATRADKVTQVRWGLEDFRYRFGREAEGLWLPETAADDETLEVLAEAGLRFTILAPGQAWRVRPVDSSGGWEEVNETIDPSRPYLWRGPRGLSLALFFYDGPISRAIAFENVLQGSEKLVARLRAAFTENRDWPQLVHCATDGESYGHHSRFGEMALAAALQQLSRDETVTLTNYGAFLADNPPTHEAQIHQGTSWSCAHGVERWRADCGCRVRGDWHQRWRAPLREALDWLREAADALYEARGSALFKDPWQARDEYVEVILDRRRERLERFLATHLRVPAAPASRLEARRLLELQRNRLLMYTSCGWFFDEISGIEPVQILRYAAMTLQYVQDLGGGQLEPEFQRRLSAAPSNVSTFGDGGEVYRRLVAPAVVDLRRVLAHYAITGLFDEQADDAAVYAYHVRRLDEARASYGTTALRIGHVEVEADVTGETREAAYALLHFGGHDFSCALQAWESRAAYDRMKDDLLQRYARYSLADMVRGIDDYFRGEAFGLPHLFLEERRRVLARVIATTLDKHEATYRGIWEENRKLVRYLRQADAPIPEALAFVARHVLQQEALAALADVDRTGVLSESLLETLAEASALGLTLDVSPAKATLQAAIERALDAVAADPTPERLTAAVRLITDARTLALRFGLWAAQNRFFEIWRQRRDARPRLQALGVALGFKLAVEAP